MKVSHVIISFYFGFLSLGINGNVIAGKKIIKGISSTKKPVQEKKEEEEEKEKEDSVSIYNEDEDEDEELVVVPKKEEEEKKKKEEEEKSENYLKIYISNPEYNTLDFRMYKHEYGKVKKCLHTQALWKDEHLMNMLKIEKKIIAIVKNTDINYKTLIELIEEHHFCIKKINYYDKKLSHDNSDKRTGRLMDKRTNMGYRRSHVSNSIAKIVIPYIQK